MKKSTIYENIKKFLFSPKQKIDPIHGFQLDKSDLGDYLSNFLTKEQANIMLNNINSLGYLDYNTGLYLKSLIDNNDYDLYIKSIHDSQVESIFNEGIRCFGNSSSIGTLNPTSVEDVDLDKTIERIWEFAVLISRIKGNNGISQGSIKINGTLILLLPKNILKEDVLYFNQDTETYNIKPSYIIGFLPVDKEQNVKDWIFPNNKEENISHYKK